MYDLQKLLTLKINTLNARYKIRDLYDVCFICQLVNYDLGESLASLLRTTLTDRFPLSGYDGLIREQGDSLIPDDLLDILFNRMLRLYDSLVSTIKGKRHKVKGVNKLMAGQLIFAFPAVGKSTFKRNHKNVIDMELSDVKYDNTGLEHLTHEERKMMPRPLLNENYKDEFKKVQGYINNGQDVLVGLCYLPHFLVTYPKLVKSSKIFVPSCKLKQEYLSRYRARGNNEHFIKRMGKWFLPTTLIFSVLGIFFKQITIVKSGKYLSDYL